MANVSRDTARLKVLIEEAKNLFKFTLHSNSANHFQEDYKEAWDFVRRVARLEIEES